MATIDTQKVRKGDVYKEGSDVLYVLSHEHNKRGRGQATIRLKVRNIKTNAITEKTYSNKEKLQTVGVFKKSAQYLYKDSEKAYFLDSSDFSQFGIILNTVKSYLGFLNEGEKVVVLWLEDAPLSIEIPGSVILTITEADNAVAGDTATGATKIVTLETGLKVAVPLFLKTGDKVKVNTETSQYVSKA